MDYLKGKRVFDAVGSSLLIILFFPVATVISACLAISMKGEVFVRQKRVGQFGREFLMYKFRTMYVDTHPYQDAPESDTDERITRLGKLLRRSSLDELPQLWNVLNGTMSLVGPRPEMPYIVAKYNDWERKRLEVKPGLTGLWQISGRKDIPLSKNIAYDIQYVNHQNFLLDLWILAKTIPAVLSGKGAY